MEFEKRGADVTLDEYIEMIRLKTAVLIAGAARMGAVLGGADEEACRRIYRFGTDFGLAFQIQDDLLDTYGDPDTFGKEIGGDIAEGKKTFLLITAYNALDEDGRRRLDAELASDLDRGEKLARVRAIYDSVGVRESAGRAIKHYYDKAMEMLDTIDRPEESKKCAQRAGRKTYQKDELMTRKDIEIMAPVGSFESLWGAIKGGCDAIYFGVGQLNMRSSSSFNFTLDDLHAIVATCKEHGIKSYLTVNCIFYDDDLADMRAIIDAAAEAGVSAVIASDQAAILYARSKGVEVHISTQLNVSNIETLRFYAAWADVVVLARELDLTQVRRIHEAIERERICGPKGELIKIEMFVHGALCMAVSGKCYLSLHEANKSANRGSCRQICRRSYRVTDMETGAELEVENNT